MQLKDIVNLDDPSKCGLCGAQAAQNIGGIWYCKSTLGGCDRTTVPEQGLTPTVQTWSEVEEGTLCDGQAPTDIGNARRLISKWGNEFHHAPGWGFLLWDGYRWSRDRNGGMSRLAKDTIAKMINVAGEILTFFKNDREHKDDVKDAKKLLKWAETSSNDRRIKAMLEVVKSEPEIVIDSSDFDARDNLFNSKNATINLETGEAGLPEPGHCLTRQSPVRFDEEAKCPQWEQFLYTIMGGDMDLVSYLQRVVGYTLTGATSEQCIFLLHGTGANGKSTFLNVVGELMGEYGSRLDASSFLLNKHAGVPNDLAKLQGVRFVSAVEVGEGRRLNEVLVKQLSGGERISARFLYQEFFEFVPKFKLFFASNHKPEIHGQDYAIWRRIHLIPFEVTIPPNQQDPDLFRKLIQELPGILNWAIKGAITWHKERLAVPQRILAATTAYKEEMDIISEFLSANCHVEPELSVGSGELYRTYVQFCEESKEKPLTQNAFGRRLTEHGIKGKKGSAGRRVWLGVGLNTQGTLRESGERPLFVD